MNYSSFTLAKHHKLQSLQSHSDSRVSERIQNEHRTKMNKSVLVNFRTSQNI